MYIRVLSTAMQARYYLRFCWRCFSNCCLCISCRACMRAIMPVIFFGFFLFSSYLASSIFRSFSSSVVLRNTHMMAALKNSDMK